VRLTTSSPSVRRMSRQCGLNILKPSKACCGNNVTLFYVNDVRISREIHMRVSTVCYRANFTFHMQVMFVPHRKNTYGTPRPGTRIALFFIYMCDVRNSQEANIRTTTACYRDIFTFYMQVMFVPHRKHIRNSETCYGDDVTSLYACDNSYLTGSTRTDLHGVTETAFPLLRTERKFA
jgi:hypothetical protein